MPTTRHKRGKTDYNFDWNVNMYDDHDWANRKSGQPFSCKSNSMEASCGGIAERLSGFGETNEKPIRDAAHPS